MISEREYLTGRMSRRRVLQSSALAGVGLVAGWLAWPERVAARLCSCDIWFCGVYSPVALIDGGRSITLYGAVFGTGEVNASVRVKVTQASTGAVAEARAPLEGVFGGSPEDPERIPWTFEIAAPEPTLFAVGDAHVDVWLQPEGEEVVEWDEEVRIIQYGANDHFRRTWIRADKPVFEGEVSRTWMWGPKAFTRALTEEYAESPGGQRTVQYYDKSRMEITHPDADPNTVWYVTNGLLVVELITGQLQVGAAAFQGREPADVNVAGDEDDPTGPTYATFSALLDAAPLVPGSTITQRIDRAGNVSDDPALAAENVSVAQVDDVTNHAIAVPFWEFMTSAGTVWENGAYVTADLFSDPYYATGRPITEPYWAEVQVAGTARLVLVQCFERRCLTYTPDNPPEWQVEAGNVGRHYYTWRYGQAPPA